MSDRRGDEGFERLYEEHHRSVYRFVLGRVRNRQEAEDVTQHAFLDALRALNRGNSPARPGPWVHAIASNVVRRRRRRARFDEVPLDELQPAPHADEVAATAAEIKAALEALPVSQREVFVLREVQGKRATEVAEQLGTSVAAVEMLLFRARRAFRAHFEEERRSPLGSLVLVARSLIAEVQPAELGAAKVAATAAAIAVAAGAVGGSSGAARAPTQSAPGAGKSTPAPPSTRVIPARGRRASRARLLPGGFAGTTTLPARVRSDLDDAAASPSPPTPSAPAAEPSSRGPVVATPDVPVPLPVAVPALPAPAPNVATPTTPLTP